MEGIESPEVNPHIYGLLVLNKGVKTIQWGKELSFQQTVLRQLHNHMPKTEGGAPPHTMCKIN